MNVLIFNKIVSGHNMEFLHHLYMGGIERPYNNYFIAVPMAFNNEKEKLEWPEVDNVHFCFLPDKICIERKQIKNFFSDVNVLREIIKQNNISEIIFVNWISPLVYWFLPASVHLSGITYVVYLYLWDKMSFMSKVKRVLKELLLLFNPRVKRNFVQNDAVAARYLNRIYKTKKYYNLSDPVFIQEYTPKDVRKDLKIQKNKKLFLFFGNLSARKGTMTILESIMLLTAEETLNYHFVLAGRVSDDICEMFYERFNMIKDTKPITLIEGFCSYEMIHDLCYTSDMILAPYKDTTQSSGVIAYASHYRKPVIVPKEGLLGKLVRRYELGIGVDDLSPESLHKAYSATCRSGEKAGAYEKNNSIEAFVDIMLERL